MPFDIKYAGADEFHMGEEDEAIFTGMDFDWVITEVGKEINGVLYYELSVASHWLEDLVIEPTAGANVNTARVTGKGMVVSRNKEGLDSWKEQIKNWTGDTVEFYPPKQKINSSYLQEDVEFKREYETKSGKLKKGENSPFDVSLKDVNRFASDLKDAMGLLIRTHFTTKGLSALGVSEEIFIEKIDTKTITDLYDLLADMQARKNDIRKEMSKIVGADRGEVDEEEEEEPEESFDDLEPTEDDLAKIDAENPRESRMFNRHNFVKEGKTFENLDDRDDLTETKYMVCPDCYGRGMIWNADTHTKDTCDTCDGYGSDDPKAEKLPVKKMKAVGNAKEELDEINLSRRYRS